MLSVIIGAPGPIYLELDYTVAVYTPKDTFPDSYLVHGTRCFQRHRSRQLSLVLLWGDRALESRSGGGAMTPMITVYINIQRSIEIAHKNTRFEMGAKSPTLLNPRRFLTRKKGHRMWSV